MGRRAEATVGTAGRLTLIAEALSLPCQGVIADCGIGPHDPMPASALEAAS